MDGPHLPFDILVSMLDISCPSTIATCMQTCHALYRHGAKPLLDWGVELASPTDFVSFLKFMRADEKFRFQHLQKLEIIQCPTDHCDAIGALHELITHPLVSIHTLVLGDAEETLRVSTYLHGSTQTLPAALCALTTLRHLTVSTCGPQTSAFLRALRSPLETATLNLLPPPPEESWMAPPDYCPGDNDPITLLRASSAGSLHTIRGTGFGGAAPAVRKDIVPFPHVHTLNATFIHRLVESGGSRTEGAMPYTWRYIRAFPNLKRLALSMDPETRRFSDPWDGYMYGTERLEALDQVRAANREDVAALRRRGGAWVGLEEVRGGMYALYALGLALVVPRVVVENEVFDADQWRLGAVLADMRPTALVATFSGVQKTFETVSPRGTTLSQPEGTSRLTKIELVVEFDTGEGNVDVGVVLDCILSDFISIQLTSLALTLDYGKVRGSPVARFLEGLDLEACAQSFSRAIPSLQHVVVNICYHSSAEWGGGSDMGEGREGAAEWLSDDSDGDVDENLAILREDDDDGW